MEISQNEAEQLLNEADSAGIQMRRAIASSYSSPFLILWGSIWFVASWATHFFPHQAWLIWIVLDVAGGIGSALICMRLFNLAHPLKLPVGERMGWRVVGLWILTLVYIVIGLSILAPFNSVQLNAFICTAAMFAYAVIGLWFASYHMVWLALVVTAITLVGFYIVPRDYYSLWMGTLAGGALLGTGLYTRFRWR